MSRIITFVLFLFLPIFLFAQKSMLMPPYLQAVTTTSVYALIESSTIDTVSVEYGKTGQYGQLARTESIEQTVNKTYVHNVKLTGLSPNTEYRYRARQNKDTSLPASFRSAVLPGMNFRFAFFADCRTNTDIHDLIAARISLHQPVVSLYGGDLCFKSTYESYKEQFFRPNQQALIAQVPFFNAVGNHEGWKENTKAFTQAPQSNSGTQDYYSFDYGDMHVLVLNTEIAYDSESPQYTFAQQDLSSTTKPWKVVVAHKPAYCKGGHGEEKKMIEMTTKVFEPNKVNLYLGGHSHFYQHNFVNGIHHLVIGSAGAPLYTPVNTSYTLASAKSYCYSIADVSPKEFNLLIYNEKGEQLDRVYLKK
ncbi:MAG: metallophosphoesterase [bacterium]